MNGRCTRAAIAAFIAFGVPAAVALLLYAIDPDEPIESIFAGLSLVIALALWPAGTDVPIARLALALVCGQATAYYLIMRAVGTDLPPSHAAAILLVLFPVAACVIAVWNAHMHLYETEKPMFQ